MTTSTESPLTLPTTAGNTGPAVDELSIANPAGTAVIRQRVDESLFHVLLSAANVTGAGSTTAVIRGCGERELTAIINIKTTPTGTTPTLTLKMQDVDPVDESTVIGQAVTTAALNATGVTVITHRPKSPTVLLTYTVAGTTPVFPSVNLTVASKIGDDTTPVSVNKTNVSASASSVTILAANSARKKFSVVNDSVANLRLDQSGGTATSTAYTDLLVPGAEILIDTKVPSGLITGIWDATGGNGAIVTEYV